MSDTPRTSELGATESAGLPHEELANKALEQELAKARTQRPIITERLRWGWRLSRVRGAIKSIFDTYDPLISWRNLRRFGKNRALRSSYFWFVFVPIAARLVSEFEEPVLYKYFGGGHKIDLALPFSWYALFVASLFFAAASLIFSSACPSLIRDYEDFTSYYSRGHGVHEMIEHMIRAESQLRKSIRLFTGMRVAVTRTWIASGKMGHPDEFPPASTPPERQEIKPIVQRVNLTQREHLTDVFEVLVEAFDTQHRGWRQVSAACYLIGFGSLAVICAQNIVWVARTLV